MGKISFVFPGQGSQKVGMIANIAQQCPEILDTYTQASEVLGFDLWDIVQNGPVTKLNQTSITQPAILSASYALWRVWQNKKGNQPILMAGHSLGEYSALVCADALNFTDGISLVAKRGELMQNAVPEGSGAMAAILGLPLDKVKQACELASESGIVTPVNLNSPDQTVISGQKQAVERAITEVKNFSGRAILLPVSVPSHSALMKPAADEFAKLINSVEIRSPKIPVIHNTSVKTITNPDEIRATLVEQLYNPVRWVETIEVMLAEGIEDFIECGPGMVLSGLIKRIRGNVNCKMLSNEEHLLGA